MRQFWHASTSRNGAHTPGSSVTPTSPGEETTSTPGRECLVNGGGRESRGDRGAGTGNREAGEWKKFQCWSGPGRPPPLTWVKETAVATAHVAHSIWARRLLTRIHSFN